MSAHDANARPPVDVIETAAADWVLRHDRGLSPEEQDRYLQWLASDSRHASAMVKQRRVWEAFDRLAGLQASVESLPDPDLLAPLPAPAGAWRRHQRMFAWAALPLTAAVMIIGVSLWQAAESPSASRPPDAVVARLAPIEERVLEDGSVVRLNRGAAIAVKFTAIERRVLLLRGEAAFQVAKNPLRPFIVSSAGVAVRAVGTAFNVRLGDQAIELIVTEGRVAVAGAGETLESSTNTVDAGHRTVVPLTSGGAPPTVSAITAEELARRLAWQPRFLTFADEPLTVILNEFNRHNPVSLRIDDPVLGELRLSARFRSDNVQGFLRLLASDFRVRAEFQAGGEIILRAAR